MVQRRLIDQDKQKTRQWLTSSRGHAHLSPQLPPFVCARDKKQSGPSRYWLTKRGKMKRREESGTFMYKIPKRIYVVGSESWTTYCADTNPSRGRVGNSAPDIQHLLSCCVDFDHVSLQLHTDFLTFWVGRGGAWRPRDSPDSLPIDLVSLFIAFVYNTKWRLSTGRERGSITFVRHLCIIPLLCASAKPQRSSYIYNKNMNRHLTEWGSCCILLYSQVVVTLCQSGKKKQNSWNDQAANSKWFKC